jgi:hypothetical protein
MNQLIEDYNKEYKDYKNNLYVKLTYLLLFFVAFLIPTIVYFSESLFVRILFWVFASIVFTIILLFIGLLLYVSERPMYEFLYKKIIDEAFEDDFTHYEYECFPNQYPFIERGHLFKKTHSEVVRYRLTYHYLNNRIDLYSFYAYSKLHKSNQLVFNGIYFVLHCDNKSSFELRTKGRLPHKNDELNLIESHERYDIYAQEEAKIPNQYIEMFNKLQHDFKESIYMRGVKNEVHIAIDRLYDKLAVKEIDEEKIKTLRNQIRRLVQIGKDLQKKC